MIVSLHATNYFPWARIGVGYSLEYGVSFFFVSSGFILTHVYQCRSTRFAGFIIQRLTRLWPVHIAVLLFVIFFIKYDSQQLAGENSQPNSSIIFKYFTDTFHDSISNLYLHMEFCIMVYFY